MPVVATDPFVHESSPDATTTALRVAVDLTPLLGPRTGIGNLVAGMYDAIRETQASIAYVPFAMTARSYRTVAPEQRTYLPARVARAVWERCDAPPIEWWTGRVDVVHGTNYIVPPTRKAVRLVSVHDLVAVHYPSLCTPDVQRMPALLRRSLRSGAHVHADSDFVANEIVEVFGVPHERVHRVYPGIPPVLHVTSSHTDVPPFGGRPFVLALGTLEPRKQIPLLVKAFTEIASEVRDLQLVVAGRDGWGVDEFTETVSALPKELQSRVIREREVSDARRTLLLRHAEALVYPSVYEGFGFPPLEALQLGTPVVCSSAGSLPEVVGDAAEYFDVGNLDGLAAAICRALRLPDRTKQSEGGRAQAAKYNWSTMATEMSALYRTIAERRP